MQEGQDGCGKLRNGLVAHHCFAQISLRGLKPLLALATARVAHEQDENGDRQPDAAEAGDDGTDNRRLRGSCHLDEPGLANPLLLTRHARDLFANIVHDTLAAISVQRGYRSLDTADSTRLDNIGHDPHSGHDPVFQRGEGFLLNGIGVCQAIELAQFVIGTCDPLGIRFKIDVPPRQQISALPGLGIEHGRQHIVERGENAVRAPDFTLASAHILDVQIRHGCTNHKKGDPDNQPHDRPSAGNAMCMRRNARFFHSVSSCKPWGRPALPRVAMMHKAATPDVRVGLCECHVPSALGDKLCLRPSVSNARFCSPYAIGEMDGLERLPHVLFKAANRELLVGVDIHVRGGEGPTLVEAV